MSTYKVNILGVKTKVLLKDLGQEDLNGYFDPTKNQIVIDENLKESEYYKTLIHETIHAAFHRASIIQAIDEGVEEIICDLVATVLTENFRITELNKKRL